MSEEDAVIAANCCKKISREYRRKGDLLDCVLQSAEHGELRRKAWWQHQLPSLLSLCAASRLRCLQILFLETRTRSLGVEGLLLSLNNHKWLRQWTLDQWAIGAVIV